MNAFALESSAFGNEQAIPSGHTCAGEDVSPRLRWTNVPEGTRSLARVVDDPDAPGGVFTHWVAWASTRPPRGWARASQRHTRDRTTSARPATRPVPAAGHGRHRYVFRLYALDTELELGPGAAKAELEHAIEGRVNSNCRRGYKPENNQLEVNGMASARQTQAAKRNVKKAREVARRKRTIARLPKRHAQRTR
jgi:hypothetical protein